MNEIESSLSPLEVNIRKSLVGNPSRNDDNLLNIDFDREDPIFIPEEPKDDLFTIAPYYIEEEE